MNEFVDRARRHSTAISVALLALLAYVPSLTAAPGRMPTDSKLYVYLDPGRFVGDTTTTFDPRQFAGWVPHQHIAYLWPTGPWYWVFEQLGAPDWIAHRLWIGTLLFAAGLGVRWMGRLLGFAPLAALAAALVYQLSPYILPYISRTSVLLLPFAGLGWIVGCTILATRRGRWRYPAAVALIVLTVGAVNATALAMIIPAPFLWLVHAAWQRSITWRRAGVVAVKVSVLSTGVSLWWMAMLVIQGRYGADVLAYSESLESVSFTSTSTEVARGLGYWLFYIRDAFTATTTASLDHLVSVRVILAGFVLLAACLAGVVGVRSPHRRFAGLLVASGVILGVGVHPIDDPSPLMDVLVGDGQGGLALALRSSTRAVPVLLLGLAIGAASIVTVSGEITGRIRDVRPATGRIVAFGAVAVLAVVNLPALRSGGFVDPALERDQDPPAHWIDAAAALDGRADGYRVLQVPGTEFGAFAWGYTVDQPLPGLTERPLVTRDLLPLGSPAAMDLAFALDDRLQEGTAEAAAFAPIARLLGVDTIWVSGDVSFERFGLARPEVVTDLLTSPEAIEVGLSTATPYGPPAPVTPAVPVLDAETLGDPRIDQPIAPITLVDVDDPVPTVRVKDETVLLLGSGDGLVDAAAAGLIDGTEAVVYAASAADIPGGVERVVLTDSNRRRAHHWRSSQDVHGYTESGGDDSASGVLRFEPADQRLPVFGDDPDPATQTISIQRGPVTAQASSYGESFAYRPEDRPVMAIDGDVSTAWLVADRAPAIGEFIELSISEPIDHLDLRQPDTPIGSRSIGAVDVTVDGGSPQRVALGPESFADGGQRVAVDTDGPSTVRITIVATDDPQPPIADAIGAVGFAEISTGDGPTVEWIRPPLLTGVSVGDDEPIDIVLSRLRTDPTDRWRDDPEPVLRREIDLPVPLDGELGVTIRFDQRASGSLLAEVLAEPVTDNRHLTGVPAARGAAAFDGDPSTSWITPFVDPVGSSVTYSGVGTVSTLALEQPQGHFSPITAVRIDDGAGPVDVPVLDGEIALPRPMDLASLTIEIVSVDPQLTIDRRYAEPFLLPAAIGEILLDGESPQVAATQTFEANCRDDLLTIDGTPVPVSFTASLDEILTGAAIDAVPCEPSVDFDVGVHRMESSPSSSTGYDVDRVTVTSDADTATVADIDPTATVLLDSTRRSRTIEVPPCPDGCWVIVGEGFNEAWSAAADGTDLGSPTLIDGNANGWWLAPSDSTRVVTAEWTAQRPLNIAFALSLLSIVAALGLIVWDRRRDADPGHELLDARPQWAPPVSAVRPVAVAGVVTTLASGLFIGWPWMIVTALVWAGAIVIRRPRLVGWVGWSTVCAVGLVVTAIVREDRPFPNAGWPVRFEWLHGWTLVGIVLIAGSTLLPDGVGHAQQPAEPDEAAER